MSNNNINLNFGTKETATLSKEELLVIIDSSLVYPTSKSLAKREKDASLVVTYNCRNKKCDFAKAIEEIVNSGELKALGVKELAKQVMLSVEQNPDVFPSCDLGGYLLQTTGIPFLFVKNDTLVDSGNGVRYGFAELTEIRKKLVFEAMRKMNEYPEFTTCLLERACLPALVSLYAH
jgi:hypothetical protein